MYDNKKVYSEYLVEVINMIFSIIDSIILTQDRLSLIKAEIISLLNENCFKVLLTKKVLINISTKRKLQIFLIRHKLYKTYVIMYALWKKSRKN